MSLIPKFSIFCQFSYAFICMPDFLVCKGLGEQIKIVFLFYEGMNALDVVGPHKILCDLPGAKVFHAAKHPGLITTDSGLKLTADCALSDILEADILVVPGASSATTLRSDPEIFEWVRRVHRTTPVGPFQFARGVLFMILKPPFDMGSLRKLRLLYEKRFGLDCFRFSRPFLDSFHRSFFQKRCIALC